MVMHLPIGYELKFNNRPGVYTVVKVLGRGASTIAYLTSYARTIMEQADYPIVSSRNFVPKTSRLKEMRLVS